MPQEEFWKITMPNPYIRRILAETEFCIGLSKKLMAVMTGPWKRPWISSRERMDEDGVLTKKPAWRGESCCCPCKRRQKQYALILAPMPISI